MDKPLTIDDFKGVEIRPEWDGMQHLCLIAKFLTEGRNGKGKMVMSVNERHLSSLASNKATMRSKSQNNKSIKINVTIPVSKSRRFLDKKRVGGGGLQFPPVKNEACGGGGELTFDFSTSNTVEDPLQAAEKVMMTSKSPGKRIKLNMTHGSTSRELSDKDDKFYGGRHDGDQETHHQLPLNFQATIREIGGSDCRLILEKTLSRSDVAKDQARFSIPPGKLRPGSLDSEAKRMAATEKGTAVRFIEPSGKEPKDMQLIFKEWKLTNNSNYVLNGKWNPVVQRNRLKVDDLVHLWFFRVGTKLGFALVNLTQQQIKRTIQREEQQEEENEEEEEGEGEVNSDGDSSVGTSEKEEETYKKRME